MVRFRVQNRLILTFGLYALAVFGLGGLLFYERTRIAMERELGEKLVAVGSVVTSSTDVQTRRMLVSGGSRTARRVSQQLEKVRDAAGLHRLYVFDRSGRSLADADYTSAPASYPELEFEREALAGVFAGEEVVGHLFTGRDGQIYKAAYLPLSTQDGIEAALAVVGSATILDTIVQMRDGILLASAIGLAGSILLSLLMARTIVNPIRRLVGAADRIGSGDLETPVEETGRDEIGYLGTTLERMRRAVLARERSLRAMLGGVAHEIRNPLGGIELFAGLLRKQVTEPKETESVDRILGEVHHLDGIITDFLQYARPTEPTRSEFEVSAVARAVDEVLEGTVPEAGIRPRFECDDARIDADPDQFRQVLINLVQNAMQAQDGDGSVWVTARPDGDMVEVVVEDEGPGIPDELRERVFEPFYTTRQQGSGLGLSIARELTERNGGSLDIVSRDPRGTAIVMRWPAARGGKS